jgi:RNA polymerase sigma-70 factor, ECF subfamily
MYKRRIKAWPAVRPIRPRKCSWVDSPDNQLIGRMQAGSLDAFEVLYRRYHDRAYRVAREISGADAYAEEAVQEAFASIWNARATYRPDRPTAAAWLLAVVRYRAIDVARRNSAYEAARVNESILEHKPAIDDVAGQALDRIELAELRGGLTLLPDVQRQVIVLAFYAGLSQTEIADQLGLPLGTVKARIRRGLARLRTGLEAAD